MIKQIAVVFGQHMDKFAHLGMSSLLYLIIYTITRNETLSIGLALSIGMFKEVLDYMFYSGISIGDILSNIMGVMITVVLLRIILKI